MTAKNPHIQHEMASTDTWTMPMDANKKPQNIDNQNKEDNVVDPEKTENGINSSGSHAGTQPAPETEHNAAMEHES
eukprot:11602717-Prorocentrum_lima.AAC.1